MSNLDRFLAAYIQAALWSSNDESDERGGEPLDKNYSADDLTEETLEVFREECIAFLDSNAADIETGAEGYRGSRRGNDFSEGRWNAYEQAGHDFWLNRNGHGCGFWDGDWPEPQASRLDADSKAFGEVNLYVGDDGRIHIL